MKQTPYILLAALISGAILLRKRNEQTSGVCGVNPYIAISKLQRNKVTMGVDFSQLSDKEVSTISTVMSDMGFRPSKAQRLKYTPEEAFYRSLQSTYRKVVSGISGAFTVNDDSRFDAYPIYNDNGEVALIYHDFNNFPELRQVWSDWDVYGAQDVTNSDDAYRATIACIARGFKFIWSDKKKRGGLKEELFGKETTGERRAYISILANREKGGESIVQFAEKMAGYNGDYGACLKGVLDALREVHSAKEARQMMVWEAERRLDNHQQEIDDMERWDREKRDEDLPF